MKCLRCKREVDEDSVYCKFCGKILKVDCPNCGEKEPLKAVSENICLKELRKARKKKKDFIEFGLENFAFPIAAMAAIVITFSYVYLFNIRLYSDLSPFFLLSVSFLFLLSLIIFLFLIAGIVKKRRRKKFRRLFPEKEKLIERGKSIGL